MIILEFGLQACRMKKLVLIFCKFHKKLQLRLQLESKLISIELIKILLKMMSKIINHYNFKNCYII